MSHAWLWPSLCLPHRIHRLNHVVTMQDSGGLGMAATSAKLGQYAGGNAHRDFMRNIKLPLD